jgi:H+/Cl- antiporter ClcA
LEKLATGDTIAPSSSPSVEVEVMVPNPALVKLAIVVVTGAFCALFGWLLVDTVNTEASFQPTDMQVVLTPIFSGALGLVLALALGVEPGARDKTRSWIEDVFTTKRLLLAAAVIYLLAAVVGGVVWGLNEDFTPDLVKALVLTVAGYLAAAVTGAAKA